MKKTAILILLTSLQGLIGSQLWAQAPIIDDSDNFMLARAADDNLDSGAVAKSRMTEEQYQQEPYNQEPYNQEESDNSPQSWQTAEYEEPAAAEDLQPLAKDDGESGTPAAFNVVEQIQSLQQEVQELRGQLEVQAHDLKLMQQQQLAFYRDLDARLQAIKGENADGADQQEGGKAAFELTPADKSNGRSNPANEQISYLAAYDLVKSKRYEDAMLAMQNFIRQYPKGGYTANAHYWLGELYLIKKNPQMAIYEFDNVLKRFPGSSKAAASQLKKGYALVDMGKLAEAKTLLQEVMKKYPDTTTAKLAADKLESL